MARIILDNIDASYGKTRVLTRLDLTVESGELHTLLGPSGCGKTTILRLIAGFLKPLGGNIHVDDEDVTMLAPEKRHMGIVFQSYALFPQMTVAQNIAYGLKAAKVPKNERAATVEGLLALLGLEEYANRNAMDLSGGQQQRVAIARALAPSPAVLLLDEPMANLDVGLRASLREEIKRIQKTTGVTTLFITHDQSEALAISDRISVMNKGVIEQTGTPREIYEHPATPFVATFVGDMNTIGGIYLRPEALRLTREETPHTWFIGRVARVVYLGYAITYTVEVTTVLDRFENAKKDFAPAFAAPSEKVSTEATADATREMQSVEVLALNNAGDAVFSVGDTVYLEPIS